MFATRLRVAMALVNKCNKQVAYEAGVSESMISQLVSGKKKASSKLLPRLAAVLGVSELWLRSELPLELEPGE